MNFRAFYDEHVALVWRTLFRLGVAKADLPDALQEVFLVAYRKLPEFEGRSKPSTWLVSICYRVAGDRRRLAHTPRLRSWQRPLVEWVAAGGYRLVKLGQRLGRRGPPPGRKAA